MEQSSSDYGSSYEYYDSGVDYEAAVASAGSAETGFQDQEYAAEYWRLDEDARVCFFDLCPEAQGESVSLGDLGELCRRMGRPIRDESEQLCLMNELDTTNQMLILRHDFITWLLKDLLVERDLANARLNVREEKAVPVAEPMWEEIALSSEEEDSGDSSVAPSTPSKYFCNVVTGESKWELPSLVQCLWKYIVGQETKRSASSLVLAADPIQSLLTEEGNMEMLQDLRVLFTKYDDDGSGALDGAEFEDMCVAIGQTLSKKNGSESARMLMRQVDPFSAQEVVSWDAFSYYWVTNAPFQRRTRLGDGDQGAKYAAWERIDVLHKKNVPVSFRNTNTQLERWNHPGMEYNVATLLRKLFPSTKLDWKKKIALFFDVQCAKTDGEKNRERNANQTAGTNGGGQQQQQCRSWDLSQCARVLTQLDHPMTRKKHVESAIQHLRSRFGGGDTTSSDESKAAPVDALDEATVTNWFLYSIRKVEMNGWEELVEPTSGQVYYYHEVNGVTQWDPPQMESQMTHFLSKFSGGGGGGAGRGATLSNDERITRIFRHYDLDESGSISYDEFQKFYRALLGKNTDPASTESSSLASSHEDDLKIQQIFRVLDTGGDGSVSLDEFQIWWKTKLQLEEEDTEDMKVAKRFSQRRELCRSFLENADALIVRSALSGSPLLPATGDSSLDGNGSAQQQSCFESNLLPRLVAVLGKYQLKGLVYRNALKHLANDPPLNQEVELEAFLVWYDAFEAAEREKEELGEAKAKAQAELLAQEAKAAAKAKEQQLKAKRRFKLKEQARHNDGDDARRKQVATLFQAFDTNGSGFLDEQELQQLTKALGHEMDEKQVHQMMQVMDTSGDKQVSLEEFWTFWHAFQRADSPVKREKARAAAPSVPGAQVQSPVDRKTKKGKGKRPSVVEASASLSVGLEMAKTRMLKLSLDDFKDALGDWKDELADKRNDRKKQQAQEANALAQKRARSVFIPVGKRRYAHFDVTWIEPEVVECVVDLIRRITASTRPLLPPDAAQVIQKIAKGFVTRSFVHKMIEARFRPHVDLHTRFFYYEDLESGNLLLDRPLYRTKTSTRAPFDLDDCDTKVEKYDFQKKQTEMRAKKRFYDKNDFVLAHPSLVAKRLLGSVAEQQPSMYAPAALYLWDITQLVHKRLLGSIWLPLRQRQFGLVELIAKRYRRQLQQRSSEAAAYLPLHYVVKHPEFPLRVIAAIAQGYDSALRESDAFGMTPLHLAFRERRSHVDLYSILIGKPGRRGTIRDHETPKEGTKETAASASIWGMRTRCGDTPLHVAVAHHTSMELMRWIMRSGFISLDVACMLNHQGESPFHVAIRRFDGCSSFCKSTILTFLRYFHAAALCSFRTKHGDLPLHLAMDAFEKMKQQKQWRSTEEEAATREGWLWLAQYLMKQFPDALLIRKASNGLLPIHLAIKYGFAPHFIHEMWLSTTKWIETKLRETHHQLQKQQQMGSSILEWTMIPETRMTLLHYAILHQPRALALLQSIVAKMPEACSMKCLPNDDLPLHLAATATPPTLQVETIGSSIKVLQLLCDHYGAGCQVYNKQRKLPLHLAISSGQPVELIQLLIESSPFALSSNTLERNGLRALILAASTHHPDYHVLATLLELTPSVLLTVNDVKKRQVTPLYAVSMHPCNQTGGENTSGDRHDVLRKFSTKFEQIDDERAYFLEMAKTKLRRKHHCPTSTWDFKQILHLMELNPLDEAVLQRSLLAVNSKLQGLIDQEKKRESGPGNPSEAVVEAITLNAELLIVRKIHQVMFEVPSNARIQVLGQGILKKLFPSAFAKAAYKSKIDPYFNL